MVKLTVGFSKPKGKIFPIYSWLIRLVEGTPYSHVFLRWETRHGIGMIYQASNLYLNFQSEEVFLEQAQIVKKYEFDIPQEAFDFMLVYCLKNCGRPYGLLEAIGYGLAMIFKARKNPFGKGESRQYCGELVYRALHRSLILGEVFDGDMIGLAKIEQILNSMELKNGNIPKP